MPTTITARDESILYNMLRCQSTSCDIFSSPARHGFFRNATSQSIVQALALKSKTSGLAQEILPL